MVSTAAAHHLRQNIAGRDDCYLQAVYAQSEIERMVELLGLLHVNLNAARATSS